MVQGLGQHLPEPLYSNRAARYNVFPLESSGFTGHLGVGGWVLGNGSAIRDRGWVWGLGFGFSGMVQ